MPTLPQLLPSWTGRLLHIPRVEHCQTSRLEQSEPVDILMGALKQANSATTLDAASGSQTARPSPESDDMDANYEASALITDSAGYLELSESQTTYVGGAHWMAILRNIPELANAFDSGFDVPDKDGDVFAEGDDGEPALTGYLERVDRQDILNAIPSKDFADSLVAVCFTNTNNEASMFVHLQATGERLIKIYERFWADPSSTPIIWVGLLFSLMCLAVQYQQYSPNEARRLQVIESNPGNLVRLYRTKAIQCLTLGKYTNAPPYAVETLLIYLFMETLGRQRIQGLDGPLIQWGNLVRIAFKAGYHRDGSNFPGISCFQAETRRRVWAILVGWDLYLSMQFAVPSMINLSLCDTNEPRNLGDEDLYEHMLELPPPRPDSAQTVPGFHVAKNRLLEIFGKISDLTMSVKSAASYAEILKLDADLTSTYESIISVWQPQDQSENSMPAASQPAPSFSMACTFLAFIYYRARIALHRRYIAPGRKYKQFTYSRKVGIEAALTILQHQWVLYLETQVGGQLCRHGWKFLILLVQDFLFATAILCAELAEEISLVDLAWGSNGTTASEDGGNASNRMRDRVFHALSSAYIVWLQSKDSESSREVKLLVASLKHLLSRAQEAGFGQTTMIAPTPPAVLLKPNADAYTVDSDRTLADQAPSLSTSTAATPQSDGIYWGIGHFPI
ncbi:hypothetical protein A1O7_07240 [Cladophialophora yegresii CBS 114405]|uniref:Xylanolytic transcriptional activator regulatory domain-containing protein n=1 Tax=Cladophialophora yegresii CBS 114405 TaxID=1182544 RepID=W9VXE4_9EURO|nr:uncharacterized protein A1O7_07240 [Cladophialophora yegresii CBS 114405]EXJ56896.1 hypothetical protein A1O7_07240 [Cladophialophora yegresii CBS 114405]